MTQKDRAIKKVQIATDKFIDLQQDLIKNDFARSEIQRILDALNSFESRVYTLEKRDFHQLK